MDLLTKMTTFVRVVEAGTLSAAAKQLRLSTAAVSRHLSALEQEVGGPLIARTTRRMALTAMGQRYYEQCLRVLHEVREAGAVGRDVLGSAVRLSVPVAVGVLAGPALARALLDEHPTLQLELRLEDRVTDLVLEDLDVALRVAPAPPLTTELIAVPLSRWTRVVVAAPSYLRRRARPKTPAALASHDALSAPADARASTWTLSDGATTARVPMTSRCTSNAGHLLRELVLEGLGVALLPDWFVADDLRQGRLERVLPAWRSEPLAVYALYRASRRGEPRVRRLVEHVREAYARMEREVEAGTG